MTTTDTQRALVNEIYTTNTNGESLCTELLYKGFRVTCQENAGYGMEECGYHQSMPDVCQYQGDNKVLVCWL